MIWIFVMIQQSKRVDPIWQIFSISQFFRFRKFWTYGNFIFLFKKLPNRKLCEIKDFAKWKKIAKCRFESLWIQPIAKCKMAKYTIAKCSISRNIQLPNVTCCEIENLPYKTFPNRQLPNICIFFKFPNHFTTFHREFMCAVIWRIIMTCIFEWIKLSVKLIPY